MNGTRLYTIGHSTLALEELCALLHENGVRLLLDVRRYPASRKHPQFNRETLALDLPAEDVAYRWMPELGGRRHARKDSHNLAWRNESFRGYADYMETTAFIDASNEVEQSARLQPTAIMCAERAWQQCHRGLISDFLKARGVEVVHIVGPGRTELHPWTAAARLIDAKLSYENPADDEAQQRLDF